MTKEKSEKLVKYQQDLKNRLTNSIPIKHKDHPTTYKQFLTRELEYVTNQLKEEVLVK